MNVFYYNYNYVHVFNKYHMDVYKVSHIKLALELKQ